MLPYYLALQHLLAFVFIQNQGSCHHEQHTADQVPVNTSASGGGRKPKLTYKQQRELEQLEKDLADLAEEKASLEESISSGALPYDALQRASERIGEIISLTDEKETRWLELSM